MSSEAPRPHSGLHAFVMLLRFHGVAADVAQLRHQYGDAFGASEMLRAAKAFGVKSRVVGSTWEKLGGVPLPAIGVARDGGFFILAQINGDKALVQIPGMAQPQRLSRDELNELWTGEVILMARRAGLDELARRFDVTWFLQAMHKYRRLLGEVLVASMFLQLFGLVSPLFFQVVIDKVLVHRGLTTLDVLIIGLVTVSVFESILTALRTYIFAHTTSRIDVELGARLFKHLTALPIAYFEARRTGDSVARVRELENIRNFLTGSALTLVVDLVFTVIFLAVMAMYSLFLTAIVVFSIPLYVGISMAVTPLFRQRLDEKFNRGAENQSFLVESVTGIETLKAMAVEPAMQRRWEEQLAGYVKASFRVLNLGNWASQSVQLVSKLVTAAILFFGARSVMDGAMSVGELVAFNMLAGRVAQPVLRLAQIWQDFQQTRVSIARLGDILNSAPEPLFTPGRSVPPALQGEVSFDHVTFRYRPDGPVILHDVDLEIPAGQMVGIVGPSGSGKSTLTKLIQSLYLPEAGQVYVDGVDLRTLDVSWLRRQIGVVLQENLLFNRSVRENIALVDPGMPMEAVVQAARLAGAHEFILELPQGYDTVVGERGASLSGGQRQRIAIARALITNPRILILDEATSALDYESERIIHDNMRQIAKGRTVIIIAHRLSAVRHCHRILTIERGRIVEDGTHDELANANGRYATLLRMQAA
ncbi:type I secretion system permease/ATPase [Bradyrhizobium sp. CCGUVB14]|uniref:type I secretion system permease/ATPase n=1 Tax=Bradyrhizobium sp. CCGUVB14 TaxID=2949628 RepID=UPI0020B444D1|nr:type I secretion system permease/ATPase [Bradyrhizobium sp. CCGUVB14]MCP3447325.1 type I secretion system permease/ATPase [Bradyrhizobium sp. CCGUVB14]